MTKSPSKSGTADGCASVLAGIVGALVGIVLYALLAVGLIGFVFYLLGVLIKVLNWLT